MNIGHSKNEQANTTKQSFHSKSSSSLTFMDPKIRRREGRVEATLTAISQQNQKLSRQRISLFQKNCQLQKKIEQLESYYCRPEIEQAQDSSVRRLLQKSHLILNARTTPLEKVYSQGLLEPQTYKQNQGRQYKTSRQSNNNQRISDLFFQHQEKKQLEMQRPKTKNSTLSHLFPKSSPWNCPAYEKEVHTFNTTKRSTQNNQSLYLNLSALKQPQAIFNPETCRRKGQYILLECCDCRKCCEQPRFVLQMNQNEETFKRQTRPRAETYMKIEDLRDPDLMKTVKSQETLKKGGVPAVNPIMARESMLLEIKKKLKRIKEQNKKLRQEIFE